MPRDHPTTPPTITSGGPLSRDASGRLVFPWLLAVLVLVAGCGGKKDETGTPAVVANGSGAWRTRDWPMARGGKELQGRVHDRVLRQAVVEWTFSTKGAVTSEAAISNGVVVFGNDEGAVVAVDITTRKERWRAITKDAVEATPAIASGRVFAGSNDGVFRALDLQTGNELWRIEGREKFPTGGVVVGSPDGLEEWILVDGYDGVSRCLRTSDGREVWKYDSQNYINGSPAILDGGLVAFGGCDSVIHVIHLKDGSGLSKVTTDAQIIRSLATWGGTVYGVNYANQLVAADVRTGKLPWVYADDDVQFLSSPALDEARIYVGSRDKHLHAVDRLSGKQVWKFRTGGRVESSPLVFDDAVVFGSGDGRLYAVDKQDGHEIWRLDLGEALTVAPAFAAGRIVIGGGEGTLFVIREGGGT
jgi:outer membrane protein assembly factor BamB